jgi:cell wall-associated NlpC family hydrolase
MTEQEQRAKIVDVALTWNKTPYVHMGRIKGAGCDCATFLLEVYEEAGLSEHIDIEYYPMDWHMHQAEEKYLKKILEHGHRVSVPQPGDIALYRYGKTAAHGAIVIDYPTIIHSAITQGVVLSNDEPIRDRLVGFFSYWEPK